LRLAAAFLAALAAAASVTCGGSTAVETVVGPDGVRCQTTLAAQPNSIAPEGGSVSVNVTAARDCTWSASTDASWMQLSATSGQGTGTVSVTVARNDQPASRNGAVVVNDQRVSINQQPRPCTYDLRAEPSRLPRPGGRGTLAIDTPSGCTWTASTSAEWLRLSSVSGSGSGTVDFEATTNAGSPREATISVAGQSVFISQDGSGSAPTPTCNATVTPSTIPAIAAGGSHSISISIGNGCDWQATKSASWITFASASSGQGSATLSVSVARNTSGARSATVNVAQQVVTINQAAAPVCTVQINPPSLSFSAGTGEGRVRVTTQDGCDWNTSGGADWTRVTNGRGTGSGEVVYTVSANTSTTSRATTLSIGGQNHSVSQQGAAPPACTFTLDPPSRTVGAGASDSSVQVNTQPTCQWTATGAPSWITVSGEQRTGPGALSYSVQANSTTSSRTGSISIGNQSHSITQEAAPQPSCTYSVSPGSLSFPAAGGDGRFTLATQGSCAWQASSGADWARLATSSGAGQSEIVYNVTANTSTSPRSTTITVNGQTHSVSQEGAPAPTCTYSLNPTSGNFGPNAGDGRFDVITQPGCPWSAQSNAGWVSASGSGNGNGTVTFTVQANAVTSPRMTTISVNGQSYTVNQEAAAAPTCTYSLQPTSQNFPAAGGSSQFTVTTQANCTFTASRGADWVTITSTSANSVSFSVAANTATSSRQTTITVNNQSFSVTQDAAAPTCTYTLSSSSGSFPAQGGTAQFTINAPSGCAWTATSGAAWVTPASTGGAGTQQVSFTVQANTGAARQTSISVTGGQSFSVAQAAGLTAPAEAATLTKR
jgi:hypothetical protein